MPSDQSEWVVYLEVEERSGARWFMPYWERAATPEEAVDQLLARTGKRNRQDDSRPHKATVFAWPAAAEFRLAPIETAEFRRIPDAAS